MTSQTNAPTPDLPADDVVAQLVTFVDQTDDFVGVSDAWGRVQYLNPAARKRLGVAALEGLTVADLFPFESFAYYYEVVRPQLLRAGSWSGEILVKTADGPAVPMYVSTTARLGPGGETDGGVVYARELPARATVASDAATLDERTGATNAVSFRAHVRAALAAGERNGDRCAVIVAAVTDLGDSPESGPDTLEFVLRAFAARLGRLARTSDVVGRVGDDRLALLVCGLRDEGTAIRHARLAGEELRQHPVVTAAEEVRAGVEVGVAISQPGDDPEAMLERASTAQASLPHDGDHVVRPTALDDLGRAMSHGDIKPYVRPVVALASGATVGYRGFARWHHPEKGLLEARAFIDAVVDSPLANVVDLFVTRETAAVIALRSRAVPLHCFTPVSPRLVADVRTEEYLSEIAAAFSLTPELMHVELETVSVRSWSQALADGLMFLRDAGFRAVLAGIRTRDDLRLAAEHGFDEIRLARSITISATVDTDARQSLHEIVQRAHHLDLVVTASAVDEERHRDLMADAGCDFATGEWCGPALPAHRVD